MIPSGTNSPPAELLSTRW